MSRILWGFFDLDASPQHGVTGDLATRLGAATETDGFADGSVFVRSDNGGIGLRIAYGDEDGWEDRGAVGVLVQAADWRSRESDVRAYRLAETISGDGDESDSTFYVMQRFTVGAAQQADFVKAITSYVREYAADITGFIVGEAFASLDGTHVVFVMAWAHEAALATLENRDGSLAAMQRHLRMAEKRSYATYARISFLRGERSEPAA